MNDENATIGIHIELVELLQDFIAYTLEETEQNMLPKSARNAKGGSQSATSSADSPHVALYLKLTVRCMTSCLRLELGVNRYAKTPSNLSDLLKLINTLYDEEVIANGCKCIRIALRDEKVGIIYLINVASLICVGAYRW